MGRQRTWIHLTLSCKLTTTHIIVFIFNWEHDMIRLNKLLNFRLILRIFTDEIEKPEFFHSWVKSIFTIVWWVKTLYTLHLKHYLCKDWNKYHSHVTNTYFWNFTSWFLKGQTVIALWQLNDILKHWSCIYIINSRLWSLLAKDFNLRTATRISSYLNLNTFGTSPKKFLIEGKSLLWESIFVFWFQN